jgi:putative SOS response-associated peptidase YedK
MCGRFAMDDKTNDLIEEFVLDGNDYRDWVPSFSIAPTDPVPVIRERASKDGGEVLRKVEPAVWDFWPQWMSADKHKRPQFNARIETVATNGMWKKAFAGSRCIVPMRGYYEWTGEAGAKDAHFLHGKHRRAAAGIYTPRKDENDEWYLTMSIITREARDASGEVHDRMPVFLDPGVFDRWLSPAKLEEPGEFDELLKLLEQVSDEVAETITTYEVDRRVNNSRTVDPGDATLIEPLVH